MSVSRWKLGALLLSALSLCACGGGGGGGSGLGLDDPDVPSEGPAAPTGDAFTLQVDGPVPMLVRDGTVDVPLRIDRGSDAAPVTLSLAQVDPGLQASIGSRGDGGSFVRVAPIGDLGRGSYPIVVRGLRGETVRDLRIDMEMPSADLDFEIVAPVRTLDVAIGEQDSVPLSVLPVTGSVNGVAWAFVGAPAGLDVSVVGSELVVSSRSGTPSGSHEVTATASAGDVDRSSSFLVRVVPSSLADGLALEIPHVVRVRRGASTDAQISVARDSGVTGNVNLSVVAEPSASLSGIFADQPLGLATTTLSISAAIDAPVGESILTVIADNGTDRAEASILVQVAPVGTPDLRIQRIELAQAFFAKDPILVGQKDTILRAHVVSDQLSTTAPVVRVEGFDGDSALGSLPLSGPAILPTGIVPSDLGQSFRATLPASWLRPGLELRVSIDPDDVVVDYEERNDVRRVLPRVGASQPFDFVIVPLVVGGRTPTIPNNYGASLEAMWPLSQVNVTVRAPYTVTSVSEVLSDGDGWSSVLSELRSLRFAEGSSAHYYGVLRTTYGSGVAGMGYVGFPSAIGWDRGSSSTDVMLHECGHNFGLRHAPCGGPSNVDANYPYSSGRIGTWGYDRRSGTLVDRRTGRDVMTYCGPEWVSDYNHEKVRQDLSGALSVEGSLASVVPEVLGAEIPLWSIRGVLKADGQVQIDPASPMRTSGDAPEPLVDDAASDGAYWLRAESLTGAMIERPLQMLEVGCRDRSGDRHFEVTIADPGQLASWSIVDSRGSVLESRYSSPIAYSGARVGTVLEEGDGVLRLSWNDNVAPRVTVVHVGSGSDAGRTALGIGLGGGSAELSTAALPSGGVFELQWTDGLNNWIETRAR